MGESQPVADVQTGSGLRTGVLVAVCLLIASINLRSVIAALSPVLVDVQDDLGIGPAAAGFAVTLSILCFGCGALVAPMLARAFSPGALLVVALGTILIGALARAFLPGTPAFFVSTVAIGSGVAIGNVIVPVLIRLNFPSRVMVMTGWYAVMLSGGAVLAAGLTRPVMESFHTDWRGGQMPWVFLAALSLLAWLVLLVSGRVVSRQTGGHTTPLGTLLRQPLAWWVTAMMGLQSLCFYSLLAWGPTMLRDSGISLTVGGFLTALMSLVAIPTSLVAPSLVQGRRAVPLLVALGALQVVGMVLIGGGFVSGAIAVVLLGSAQGATLAVSLAKIATVFPVHQTATLSAMAQGFGYLLAGLGPWLFGLLHEVSGTWIPSRILVGVAAMGFVGAAVTVLRLQHKGG